MKKTRIITIANQKGGVGKTSATVNVGSILAARGKNVLVIDMDSQANLTYSLSSVEHDENIYHALTGRVSYLPVCKISENLDLVPASLDLAQVEIEISSQICREKILDKLLKPIRDNYDFILIDCPPTLTLLTLNALAASNEIIVPLTAEELPFKGLEMMNIFISQIHDMLNPSVHLTGILINRWESSTLSSQIEEKLRKTLGSLVFKTKIRKNIRIAEAPRESRNIVDYAPKSNGAKDYKAFVDELLEILG